MQPCKDFIHWTVTEHFLFGISIGLTTFGFVLSWLLLALVCRFINKVLK